MCRVAAAAAPRPRAVSVSARGLTVRHRSLVSSWRRWIEDASVAGGNLCVFPGVFAEGLARAAS